MSRRSAGLLALVVTAAAPAAVTSARAADLPVPPTASYYPPSYQPAIYNWTGFYVGGNFGLALFEDNITATTTTIYQYEGTRTNLNDLGWMGGAQVGYNYEFAPVVVGVEGTFSGSYLTWSGIRSTELPTDVERSYTNEDWFATATARIGYAADTWLLYARGGAAWTDVQYRQDDLNTGLDDAEVSSQTLRTVRTGFTVGAGVEYGMTEHWSARLEYNFFDFGTKLYNFSNLSTVGSGPVGSFPLSYNSTVHSLTAGINYRFN
jgi:outer membrane immunogenic protein